MYGKIYKSLFKGTLYGLVEEQLVFIAMIVHADKDGILDATYQALKGEFGYPDGVLLKALGD